jgi:hypothetical protein
MAEKASVINNYIKILGIKLGSPRHIGGFAHPPHSVMKLIAF